MVHLLMMEDNCANLYWNPSKLSGAMIRTKIWPSSVTLTLGLPEWMLQMVHVHIMENNCVKLFWNPSTIVEVMVLTNSDGPMHRCMQWFTHTPNCHCDNYVLLTTSGLHKKYLQTFHQSGKIKDKPIVTLRSLIYLRYNRFSQSRNIIYQ